MKNSFTPKEIANALRASESSVKRWCDKGAIPASYTVGGHRRIALSGLVSFLKTSGRQLADPESLKLPPPASREMASTDRIVDSLIQALLMGDEQRCKQLVVSLYLAEYSLAKICDTVFAPLMTTVGEEWACGQVEVYQERRGCEILSRLLHDLRQFLPTRSSDAPLAIGGTVEEDHYMLATNMAELVLREAGWNAVSLGTNLPFATMSAAIIEHRPRIFWISTSHLIDEEAFLTGYGNLHDEFGLDVAFVVGGRALHESLRRKMHFAAYCDNMQHLANFARALVLRNT